MKLLKFFICGVVAMLFIAPLSAQEWKSGVEWLEPPIVSPGASNSDAPSDAIILFDGTSLAEWDNGESWLVEDGVAIPKKTDISSKRHFGDVQLHLEWSSPTKIEGNGQGRGNSGMFLMDRYEVQVLDSYHNKTYFDGQAGGIYKQNPPMVNAMRRPGEWNTYEIFFTAPRFKVNGDVETPAYVTVMHNGVLVQNHFELLGPTEYVKAPHYTSHAAKAPIRMQFHGNPVRFRNIWARDLHPPVGVRTSGGFNIVYKAPAPREDEERVSEEVAEPVNGEPTQANDANSADSNEVNTPDGGGNVSENP